MTAYNIRQEFLKNLGDVYDKMELGKKKSLYENIDKMQSCFEELYEQHGNLDRRVKNE